MTISFVIPVYNTAEYINRCINSIIKQDLDKDSFEIIIINDGSTDNSQQVLNEWEGKINQIKIIHTENNGLGAARNIGINLSRGQYIFFVDSDDYIVDKSLTKLIRFAENSDCDIIGFNWKTIQPNGKRSIIKNNKIPYLSVISGAEYMNRHNIKSGACFYLYRNYFLKKALLLMPEGIYHEDELFLPKAFIYARKVTFIDEIIYAYCLRKDSISNRKDSDFLQKRMTDNFQVLDELLSLSKDTTLSRLQKSGLDRKIIILANDLLINLIRFEADDNLIKEVISKLRLRNLYPLPKKNYGCKYIFCRILFNSEKNIKHIVKSNIFSKKD